MDESVDKKQCTDIYTDKCFREMVHGVWMACTWVFYAMLSQIVIVMNHKNGEPKNSFLIDLFTLGEGRHKDHHNNPKDYSKDKFIKPVINLIRVV